MLKASKLSFDKADNTLFVKIFLKAITSCNSEIEQNIDGLRILTSDDFDIGVANDYECYYIIVERRKRFFINKRDYAYEKGISCDFVIWMASQLNSGFWGER